MSNDWGLRLVAFRSGSWIPFQKSYGDLAGGEDGMYARNGLSDVPETVCYPRRDKHHRFWSDQSALRPEADLDPSFVHKQDFLDGVLMESDPISGSDPLVEDRDLLHETLR